MAITKNGDIKTINNTEGQSFDVYNGDWEALKDVTTKWGLKDEVSALRFALAVLTIAKPGGLIINGENTGPAESLLKGGDDKNK